MNKIAVGPRGRGSVDINASATDNLTELSKRLKKPIPELGVVILDRPRHDTLLARGPRGRRARPLDLRRRRGRRHRDRLAELRRRHPHRRRRHPGRRDRRGGAEGSRRRDPGHADRPRRRGASLAPRRWATTSRESSRPTTSSPATTASSRRRRSPTATSCAACDSTTSARRRSRWSCDHVRARCERSRRSIDATNSKSSRPPASNTCSIVHEARMRKNSRTLSDCTQDLVVVRSAVEPLGLINSRIQRGGSSCRFPIF